MKKTLIWVLCSILALCFVSCRGIPDTPENTENVETGTEEFPIDVETQDDSEDKETGTVDSEYVTNAYAAWQELVEMDDGYMGAQKIDKDFNSKTTDLSKWFVDYNGEVLQRILSSNKEDEYNGVMSRADIIFYNTDEANVQVVVRKMIETMIEPLMEKSDLRTYTITKYELTEQPLIQINENVWLLENISGYYSYEGCDVVTMEEALLNENDVKDGMIRFQGQGSDAVFQYLLIKEGTVYRLQRAGEMGYGIEY